MSGTGGVIRDAERRALTPVRPATERARLPEVKTEATAVNPALDAVKDNKIGEIAAIKVYGATEFAEREAIPDKLLTALGDAGEKTIGDVVAAIETVTRDFLNRGFYLVRISLAKQGTYDAASKTLSVLVDEGRFGRINVLFEEEEEGTWFAKRQILKRFENIEEGDVFDYTQLRRALFSANSHPDLTIDTAIDVRKPIEGEGNDRRVARYADLDLTVHESLPFHAMWEINNYGIKDVNEWQTSLMLQYLNLTKHDDVLTLSPAMSLGAELFSFAASYLLPHDYGRGGNTTIYGGWSRVEMDDVIPSLDLEGLGYFAGIQHSENLIETDRQLLAFSMGFLWRYIEDQYTVASHALSERGTHILPLTAALSWTGRKADWFGGRNFATMQGVFNVLSAGDDIDKTWNNADEHYWVVRGQLARLQPLWGWRGRTDEETLHNWQLFMKIEGQYTDQTLIPTEKLMLGGNTCLRGYRTRGHVGDSGVYGTFELRTPILVDSFASLFGDREDQIAFDRLQFLGFYDWGFTKYNDLPSGYDETEWLHSLGVGMRLAITPHSQIKCDLAFPLTDGNNHKDDDFEIYLGVQVQF